MQEIKQLVNVLQTVSSKNIAHGFFQKGKNLEYVFINGIVQGEFDSDSDAANKLYGTSQGDVRFKMLKHRVRKKLYSLLLTIDFSSDQLHFRKEIECERLLLVAKLLLNQTEFSLAYALSKKAKLIAQEYEYYNLYLSAIEIETSYYTNQGALKLFKQSREEFQHYTRVVALEKEAVSLFQLSMVHLKSTVKNRKTYLSELPSLIERLRVIWEDVRTYSCFYYLYRTSMLYYELTGDFEKIVTITEEAKTLVRNKLVNEKRFNASLNAYMLVYAHLRTKQYTKGLEYANEFFGMFNTNTKNWFAYMENYFLLAVHAKKYELASVLLHRVRNNNSFITIKKVARERWQLYAAYLYFIDDTLQSNKDFNYQSFINSITEYSKDKQGFNVAILILQFMYFLKKGDTEGLLYRIESLKKYILTHLKDAFSLRSKLFLRLLMLTVTEDYDATSCRAKGTKHYQKLIETPTPGDAYAEIEIVPYEHLWELILDDMAKANA